MIFSIQRQPFSLYLLLICLITGVLAGTSGQASVNSKHLSLDFLDNRLSLTAEKVPLETILHNLHENTKLEYEIPDNYLDLLISVSFQSLPLEEGLQRILYRLNYVCVIRDGRMAKVIVLPKAGPSQDNSSSSGVLNEQLPAEKALQSVPPPTPDDLIAAINAGEITPPREIEDYLNVMKTVSLSEAEEMMQHIRITPLEQQDQVHSGDAGPSFEELQSIVESMPEGL